MAREHSAAVTIGAPPERVWSVLVDTAHWPEWDPYCERIDGTPAPGARVTAYTTLSTGRAFPVRVTTFDAPRRMVWTGGMPLGLFTGRRTFALAAAGDGTAFTVTEVFTGPMLPLIRRSLPDMTEPFAAFATGLKERAETAS